MPTEWRKNDGSKTPLWIHRKDDEPFAFAGLWDVWRRGRDELASCTIITTAANDFMRGTHSRMPVVLDDELAREWLISREIDSAAALAMLVPSESADMWTMRPVSARVGNVRNDDPTLVESIPDPPTLALTFERSWFVTRCCAFPSAAVAMRTSKTSSVRKKIIGVHNTMTAPLPFGGGRLAAGGNERLARDQPPGVPRARVHDPQSQLPPLPAPRPHRERHAPRLTPVQPNSGDWIVDPPRTLANVAARDLYAFPAAVAHDCSFGAPGAGGRGREAGAQGAGGAIARYLGERV